MTTINLQQGSGAERAEKGFFSRNGGMVFSLGILLVVILALVGLKAYSSVLSAKNQGIISETQAENQKLAGRDNIDQVMDTQKRIEDIRMNLSGRTEMNYVLDKLGAVMVSGVVVDSYSDSGSKVSVSLSANNFSDVSRQILSFKKSDYFKNVSLASVNKTDKVIAFSVDMSIN